MDVTSGGPDGVMACLAVLDDLGVKATWFLTATLVEAGLWSRGDVQRA